MAKKDTKKELLKLLSGEMKGMMRDSKKDLFDGMKPEKSMKVTMMADSKEGILKAAKELPKIMSKADQIKEAKLGRKPASMDEEECGHCGKMPCECEDED